MVKTLQGSGYLISTLSVIMLGIVGWEAAEDNPRLMFLLIAGVAASILGMLLRWLSFLQDQREKEQPRAMQSRSANYGRVAQTGRVAGISARSRS